MPNPQGSPVQFVVASAMQMGWSGIPAYFCAATKTGRNLIHQAIEIKVNLPHHIFEEYMLPEKKLKWSIREESMYTIFG